MQPRCLETVASSDVLLRSVSTEVNAQTLVALGNAELLELAGVDPLQ